MKKTALLDVLVVYSSDIATSASSKKIGNTTPFAQDKNRADYAFSYAYFLDTCASYGLSAGLATSNDIVGAGTCRSYWRRQNKRWIKVEGSVFSKNIFDKFSPKTPRQRKQRAELFSSKEVKPFNDEELYNTFFDKYLTYKKFKAFTIPTVKVEGDVKESLNSAIEKLRKIIPIDASGEYECQYVMKDRFGAGGNNVYKVSEMDAVMVDQILEDHPSSTFILQPMVAFDEGYEYQGSMARADIRLIFWGSKIVQSYIRIAPPSDFRCNNHAGGLLFYTKLSDIPRQVLQMAKKIEHLLVNNDSMYSLDFLMSNGGHAYFLEGNTGPGLNWDSESEIDRTSSQALIQIIAGKFADRVGAKSV